MSAQLSTPILEREFELVINAFEESQIPYAVIGGLAVAIYGYPRYTEDLDFVVLEVDIPKIKIILQQLEYILDNGRLPFPSVGMTFYRMGKFVGSHVLSIDLLMEVANSTIWKTRRRVAYGDLEISVISKESLIEMKRKSERAKDKQDVEALLQNE
jgi:hypothetical protein